MTRTTPEPPTIMFLAAQHEEIARMREWSERLGRSRY